MQNDIEFQVKIAIRHFIHQLCNMALVMFFDVGSVLPLLDQRLNDQANLPGAAGERKQILPKTPPGSTGSG